MINCKIFFQLKEKCSKEIISTREEFNIFLEEFAYVFLPSEIKVSFFKPQKCIFSTYFAK